MRSCGIAILYCTIPYHSTLYCLSYLIMLIMLHICTYTQIRTYMHAEKRRRGATCHMGFAAQVYVGCCRCGHAATSRFILVVIGLGTYSDLHSRICMIASILDTTVILGVTMLQNGVVHASRFIMIFTFADACRLMQVMHDAMLMIAVHGADLTNMYGARDTGKRVVQPKFR